MKRNSREVIDALGGGQLVVMLSDTIYGIFARAKDEAAVQRMRHVRQRPIGGCFFIVLVPDIETVDEMVGIRPELMDYLREVWPGKVSVVLPDKVSKYPWLIAGDGTIALRVPADPELRDLLRVTGPLVAPSANLPDQLPARNITEARDYFGDAVNLYVDGGERPFNQPSRLIKFTSDGPEVLRPSADDFVITRRRKKYKFARFNEFDNCFHLDEWLDNRDNWINPERKLVVELGAGSALFSVELARRNLDKRFLAVDIKGDRLYRGARAAIEQNLSNIVFVRSDMARITEVVPPHSASEIWLTFPDPWPPKSDARHRLTAPRYLNYYREILKPSGVLHFKTDNVPLFDWSLEQFAANGWQQEFLTRDLHNSNASDEAKIMTSYEERFVGEGLLINYARFSI